MNGESIEYLPFHALNNFMQNDYRAAVIRETLQNLQKLPSEQQARLNKLTRQYVKVPGFRNSAKAPVAIRARAIAEEFEEAPELVAVTIGAWADANHALRDQMYALLRGRGWDVLPPEADRTQLPGFLPSWPEGENYDTISEAFRASYPESEAEDDDMRLMSVWISGRLPYLQEEPGEGES